MAERQVSPARQGSYYLGMVLSVIGGLIFLSTFLSVAMQMGGPPEFGSGGSIAIRAVIGMGMMIAGKALMTVGKVGLAGSGVVLNPERARHDVEPWSRATGGMISDALDEAGIKLGGSSNEGGDLPFDEKLRRLHKLHEDGILTAEEYQREKQEILRNS
jgi:hypothetical protein